MDASGPSSPKRGTLKWTGLHVDRKEEGVADGVELTREAFMAAVKLRGDQSGESGSSCMCDMAAVDTVSG